MTVHAWRITTLVDPEGRERKSVQSAGRVESDPDGRFALCDLADGRYRVWVDVQALDGEGATMRREREPAREVDVRSGAVCCVEIRLSPKRMIDVADEVDRATEIEASLHTNQ